MRKGLIKGQKLAPLKERLAKLGLISDWDFLLHLPMRYEDETTLSRLIDVKLGTYAQLQGTVIESDVKSGRFEQLIATVADDTGQIRVRFLHFYPTMRSTLSPGNKVRLYGQVRSDFHGHLEMVHPRILRPVEPGVAELPKTLTPIYPSGESITQPWLRKRIARALMDVDITETLEENHRERYGLPTLKEALHTLHRPPPDTDMARLEQRTNPAWQRVKLDELLAQQITLRLSRQRQVDLIAEAITSKGKKAAALLTSLPFTLTDAQNRVLKEIDEDLAHATPMNRLLQGDVGAGKTIVAAHAALRVIDAGYQAALMAPTEILAEQHFRKFDRLLTPLGVRIAWLSGSLKTKEKAQRQEEIAAGAYDLVIGTHALIAEAVTFHSLALAIIDEQHRFGVNQRLKLRSGTGEKTPHLLMLSATPIPRTLAMSYLADIDVSVIDELPQGRHPIQTKLVRLERIEEVARALVTHVAESGQAYWVCPLIEESEKADLTAAKMRYAWLKNNFPSLRVALVHGGLETKEKEWTMAEFLAGRIDVLVATTVIEVGVDVPNATLMVIEHAERFGLSQLHQLRGRVGRGTHQSHCILLFSSQLSEAGKKRLKVIRETNDGFLIAQEDLALRGPGEFLGARQSGAPLLRYADPSTDLELLSAARDIAEHWIKENPTAAHEHARRWFQSRDNYLGA